MNSGCDGISMVAAVGRVREEGRDGLVEGQEAYVAHGQGAHKNWWMEREREGWMEGNGRGW